MAVKIDRRMVYYALSQLSDDKLSDVFQFIRFLQFTEQAGVSPIHYADSPLSQTLKEKLAADYELLAASYDELADELADEIWLAPENEALQHTEGTTGGNQTR